MGIWSSIRDFYRRWKPEIDIYGIGGLVFFGALVTQKYLAGFIVLVLTLGMDAMRRWGEPYRQAGEKEMERRRQASRAAWEERFADLFGRYRKDSPEAPPAPAPETTHLIPRPMPDGEDPPESPAPIVETEKPAAPAPPVVTHDT